jgi:hypothetical protein
MKEQKVKIQFDDDTRSVIDIVNRSLSSAGVDAKFQYVGTEDDECFVYKLTTKTPNVS